MRVRLQEKTRKSSGYYKLMKEVERRKNMLVFLGRMKELEAWSICTKDLNGSKRVFNINFVET